MKPLNKTFRALKVHPAKECDLCAEQIHYSKTSARQEAKLDIEEAINEDLCHDDTYLDELDAIDNRLALQDPAATVAVELTVKEFMERHCRLMKEPFKRLSGAAA